MGAVHRGFWRDSKASAEANMTAIENNVLSNSHLDEHLSQ
jgi:hypothetical protein